MRFGFSARYGGLLAALHRQLRLDARPEAQQVSRQDCRLRRSLAPIAVLALASSCAPSGPPDPRPNVLLITIDTLRADHLGSYGYPLPTSPRIDQLGETGVVFERAIAAASTTAPAHA